MSIIKRSILIPAETISGYDKWLAPSVTGNAINANQIDKKNKRRSTVVNSPVTAQSVEDIRNAAYEEGFAKGEQDAKNKVAEETTTITDALNHLLTQCKSESDEFAEQVTQQLLNLVLVISKQVIRQEVTTNPEIIQKIIMDALACLPSKSGNLILKLNPNDAEVVINAFDGYQNSHWSIVEDPAIVQGGCMISTDTTVVNATLELRIEELAEKILSQEQDSKSISDDQLS